MSAFRRTSAATFVLATALLGVLLPATAAQAYRRGSDVSRYENTIDWNKVGNANITFVIARATSGNSYVDPEYLNNQAGAATEHIKFTAYHFAKPHGGTADAIDEANHFVATAGLGSDDMIPALDLEMSGGLSPGHLQDWVAVWLNRVHNQLGVKPMIYTSPSFWQYSMGDTKRFAKHGYPLWIANWHVMHPTVPADNWAHHGFTFWQYDNCGAVPGAKDSQGCSDLDRYRFKAFGRVLIP